MHFISSSSESPRGRLSICERHFLLAGTVQALQTEICRSRRFFEVGGSI